MMWRTAYGPRAFSLTHDVCECTTCTKKIPNDLLIGSKVLIITKSDAKQIENIENTIV